MYEFLEGKNLDADSINKICKWYLRNNIEEPFPTFFDKKYSILEYAGLDHTQINKLFKTNISILGYSNGEFLKLAYVLSATNYLDQIFNIEHENTLNGIKNYKRIFMRNYVLNRDNVSLDGATMLLTSDNSRAYDNRYSIQRAAYNFLGQRVSNDEELEYYLNMYFIENKKVTLDQILEKKSLEFFRKYIESKRKEKRRNI